MSDDGLPQVDGQFLPGSLQEFTHKCRVLLRDEQEKIAPDTALIDTLCDGVRLAREYGSALKREVEKFGLPEVVCLCGSTRFKDAYLEATRIFTHEGRIVLSVGSFPRADNGASPEEVLGEDLKGRMDKLHKRKIDLADRVFVINPGGYIGASTRGEIEYAVAHGKPVDYLEDPA